MAPSLGPSLEAIRFPVRPALVDRRVVFISAVAIVVALASGVIAQALMRLIALVTHIAFYGEVSTRPVSPAGNHLGPLVIVVPIIGAVLVGFMARYGSEGIRGHGIPEAMEQILVNESRIPPRLTFLKPISAAISIGTGGPFGAEGPIIATGGALGSLAGQLLKTTAIERKTLLAAGAAAGMAATFGSPVSAVLLAVELLLFEFRPRSIIPVALASVAATAVRMAFVGSAPIFPMPELMQPGGTALAFYILLGAVVGVASVVVTRLVYAVEDGFELMPVHWMWWPAIGAVAVGIVGYIAPRTFGVGYDNIEAIVSGTLFGRALIVLFVLKFVSWCIALGSGTSGGTLAPLFTIGGGLGGSLGAAAASLFPGVGIDVRIAALVGMASLFAGASRALLTSVVFAFETTLQPFGLLPLLGGCTAAYLVSALLMPNTIMTEKIVRRGVRVPSEYAADFLDHVLVRESAAQPVVSLGASDLLGAVRAWIAGGSMEGRHQGYPVVEENGDLIGVVTRRDLLDPAAADTATLRELVKRPPAVAFEDSSIREAADLMLSEDVGRLPVVHREAPNRVTGMLTRSDILASHRRRIEESNHAHREIRIRRGDPDRSQSKSSGPGS